MGKGFLKKALFGYSKTSVCEYIAKVNEEYSQKLFVTTEEHRKEKDELKSRIAALESELADYKRTQGDITTALLDAQQYATTLKQKAEMDDMAFRAELTVKHDKQTKKLQKYTEAVSSWCQQISLFALETDEQLMEFVSQSEKIKEDYVDINI